MKLRDLLNEASEPVAGYSEVRNAEGTLTAIVSLMSYHTFEQKKNHRNLGALTDDLPKAKENIDDAAKTLGSNKDVKADVKADVKVAQKSMNDLVTKYENGITTQDQWDEYKSRIMRLQGLLMGVTSALNPNKHKNSANAGSDSYYK